MPWIKELLRKKAVLIFLIPTDLLMTYHTLYTIHFFSLSFSLRYKLRYVWKSNKNLSKKVKLFFSSFCGTTSLFHPFKHMSICFVYSAIQQLNLYPAEQYQGNQLCYPPFEYLSPEVELTIHRNLPLNSCNQTANSLSFSILFTAEKCENCGVT